MGHKYVKTTDVFSVLENGAVPKPSALAVANDYVLSAAGIWVPQSGGGGGTEVVLASVYNEFNDPINHTFTATEAGRYLVVAVAGDNQDNYGNQVSSTGTLIWEETATPEDRHPFINIYELQLGDTITIKLSNYSGGAYRGTMAVIAKMIGYAVQSLSKVYEQFDRDTLVTKTTTLGTGNNYLLIGTSCGGTSISSNISFNGAQMESGISYNYTNIFAVKSFGTDVTQSQRSDLAGGSYVAGFLIV